MKDPRPGSILVQLGPALRRLRHRRRMSQKRIAEAANVTRAMVSAYESGSHFPSLPTLDRLLHTLGASFAELEAEMLTMQRGETEDDVSIPVAERR